MHELSDGDWSFAPPPVDLLPGFPLSIKPLNSVTKGDIHGARASPDSPYVSGKLEKRNPAVRIAAENVAVGKDLDAGKPADAQFRQVCASTDQTILSPGSTSTQR
ncbi:MAG: hypothetical protein NT154_46355 [Verrucomicrobia bacterium]|nr:hypothetical protein [Verrucomicrobiota bacterium]